MLPPKCDPWAWRNKKGAEIGRLKDASLDQDSKLLIGLSQIGILLGDVQVGFWLSFPSVEGGDGGGWKKGRDRRFVGKKSEEEFKNDQKHCSAVIFPTSDSKQGKSEVRIDLQRSG